ncbi:MAG: hypothetical protein RLZ98_597 [Pseudomonadota bacterium]|jgi:Cu/Ag efflux protein CusF
MRVKVAAGIVFCVFVSLGAASAQHTMEHGKAGGGAMDHGAMHGPANAGEAKVEAIVHSVDATAGKINVTHEPVKAFGWPKMTMDLDVTKRVDLSYVKPGSKVLMTLKQGMDKKYRVIAMEPSK